MRFITILDEKIEKLLQLYEVFTPKLSSENTALIIIDMQEYQVRKSGVPYKTLNSQVPGILDYFVDRVEKIVEPNLIELIDFCRQKEIRIIFTKLCSFSENGSDLNRKYQKMNELAKKFSNDVAYPPICHPKSEIISSLKPHSNDLLIIKNTSGTFMSTRLDTMLNNMGITNLIITGVVTHFCVSSTAREASDLGFDVIILEVCCAGWTEQLHESALKTFALLYGNVMKLKKLKKLLK